MPKPLRVVPTTPDPRFRSVDPGAVTIPVLNSEVPDADADAIFDALGVQPMALQRKWERMAPSARIAAQGKWRRDWAKRHGRPHPDDWPGGSTPTVPSDEERTRDDRIAAAMRSYRGPRTKRQGWPVPAQPPPTRRHAGHLRIGPRAGGRGTMSDNAMFVWGLAIVFGFPCLLGIVKVYTDRPQRRCARCGRTPRRTTARPISSWRDPVGRLVLKPERPAE